MNLTAAQQRAVDSDSPLTDAQQVLPLFQPQEIWKPVIGYEGLYEVSSLGNVRSISRSVTFVGRWGTKRTNRLQGEVLFQYKRKDGYRSVSLSKFGSVLNHTVHRLVVGTFYGISESQEVNHKDGKKDNNAAWNLEPCSHSHNHRHALRTGLLKPVAPKGVKCHFAVINDAIVLEIRKLYSEGLKVSVIARRFKVSWSCADEVIKGQTWRHVR